MCSDGRTIYVDNRLLAQSSHLPTVPTSARRRESEMLRETCEHGLTAHMEGACDVESSVDLCSPASHPVYITAARSGEDSAVTRYRRFPIASGEDPGEFRLYLSTLANAM